MKVGATTFDNLDRGLPRFGRGAFAVWRRNLLVWRKLMGPSLLFNFGEPFIYLLGLGLGLGHFVRQMSGIPYLTFLASGLLASSAMNSATFEGLYSVYTRMVPQQTYEGMLATPLDVDDIVAGELLWCASKGVVSSSAILVVAWVLGAVHSWSALLCLPVFFLVGLCFAGPAIMVTSVSPSYDFFNYYVTLFITPMFMLCGVFYPVSTLPAFLRTTVQFLPLTHAVALVRPLVSGQTPNHVLLHVIVLGLFSVAGFYISVILTRKRLIH